MLENKIIIDQLIIEELEQAYAQLFRLEAGTLDQDTILDFIRGSRLKGVWQVVFKDVNDIDFQMDIDNEVRCI